jgi:two-component system, LytTR family, sensor kinase
VERFERKYLRLRELNWRRVLGVFAALLVCFFFYRYLERVAMGQRGLPLVILIEQGSGIVGALLLFPVSYLVAVRFPLIDGGWKRYLPVHLAAVVAFSFIETTLMALQREAIFRAVGWGHYDYGYMPVRYPMEFSQFFIFYWVTAGAIYLYHEIRFAREREIRQAHLQASLAEAQLRNLRLQLEPHFLFNTLNAISAAIYEDPRVADEMIGRLSEFLRLLLKQDRSQEVPLAREIEFLRLYTRIMEARLEDRLKLSIDIDERACEALVPQLILQPLLENAIRHGMDLASFDFDIAVTARLEGNRVVISVRDHGPGLADVPHTNGGIGLRNTVERLKHLYGDQQTFTLRNAPGGGAIAEMHLPFREIPAGAAS